MIDFWAVVLVGVIASLLTGILYDHENKKAYNKGYHDAMAAKTFTREKGEK